MNAHDLRNFLILIVSDIDDGDLDAADAVERIRNALDKKPPMHRVHISGERGDRSKFTFHARHDSCEKTLAVAVGEAIAKFAERHPRAKMTHIDARAETDAELDAFKRMRARFSAEWGQVR